MENIRYNEDDFEVFLEELISSGRLELKEVGIKLYLDKGYDAYRTNKDMYLKNGRE